ncbi:SGNH/GDSL hydrolase family protein [Neobacillus sp. C211]|uniref:SGNH/GDSL hydrolase family protein n=1 Tax=unclassified Neobacillus TaxID=2675272 RepID=UPI00397D5ADC
MLKFLTALLAVGFLITLYLGQSHWDQERQATAKSKPFHQSSTSKIDDQNPEEQELLNLTSNWPANAVDQFKQSLKEDKPFTILFAGSPAIGSETAGSFPLIKEKLIKTFGEQHIKVELKTFNLTSTQFLYQKKQAEIAAVNADLIIFEPFIQKNNGEVLIKDTLQNTSEIIDDIQADKPETAFILQPSFPLYQAEIYPHQVAELKKYAQEKQLTYLDHWTAWPDSNTVAMKDYLQPDMSAPNVKGDQLWSEYILKFLTNSKNESE